MKRMTLLTPLALVFSLFTVTAAIAGPGPGSGEGDQAGDTVMTQTQDRECQADDCQTGEMVMTRTQTRTQDGECQADDCQAGEQVKAQAQTQARAHAGECEGDDCQAEEALTTQEQVRERLVNRIAAMLGEGDAEVEGQYRLVLNLMLQNMLRYQAMFL